MILFLILKKSFRPSEHNQVQQQPLLIGMNPRIKKHEIVKGIFMLFISNFHQQIINNVNVDNCVEYVYNTMIRFKIQ